MVEKLLLGQPSPWNKKTGKAGGYEAVLVADGRAAGFLSGSSSPAVSVSLLLFDPTESSAMLLPHCELVPSSGSERVRKTQTSSVRHAPVPSSVSGRWLENLLEWVQLPGVARQLQETLELMDSGSNSSWANTRSRAALPRKTWGCWWMRSWT
ncbi:unnamed protein product [Coccothraustes coccothraustes]